MRLQLSKASRNEGRDMSSCLERSRSAGSSSSGRSAIHDQLLDLFADRIRKSHTTRGLDFAKWHADPTVVWSIRC